MVSRAVGRGGQGWEQGWKRGVSPGFVPPDLFVGQLKSSLTCNECGYCSTAFDPFWDLSLPIPKVRGALSPYLQHSALHTLSLIHTMLQQKSYGEVTLMDCLRLFTKEDVLDGDEKPVWSGGHGACLGAG